MERGDVPNPAEDTIRLPAEPASAALAREFVRGVLSRSNHPRLEDAALLCVTELVANVTVHTDSPECVLKVIDTTDEVTIEVIDLTREMPSMTFPSVYAEHGRGLQIISALAGEWGVRPLPDHSKAVWLRLCDP